MAKLEYYAIEELDLTGYELILPGLSSGTVGTLMIDLLLNNVPHKRIGHFYSHHF